MLYLKLNGETIMGHKYHEDAEHNFPVDVDRVARNGKYIYKVVDGELIELSQTEINSHPLVRRNRRRKKLCRMKERQKDKLGFQNVQANETLTAAEQQEVTDMIAELDALVIDEE